MTAVLQRKDAWQLHARQFRGWAISRRQVTTLTMRSLCASGEYHVSEPRTSEVRIQGARAHMHPCLLFRVYNVHWSHTVWQLPPSLKMSDTRSIPANRERGMLLSRTSLNHSADYRMALNNYLQERGERHTMNWDVYKTGPDHMLTWHASVYSE